MYDNSIQDHEAPTTVRDLPAMSPARDERRAVTSFANSSPSFTQRI